MKSRFFLLVMGLLVISGFAFAKPPHPFYVSVTQIEHNPETESLEIAFKIFVDDLNTALEAKGPAKIWLGDDQEHPEADNFIFSYLQEKVFFRVNGEVRAFSWVGREIEEDVIWVYVEIKEVPKLETLELSHRLLLEQFATQTNIVHAKAYGKEHSVRLHREDSRAKMSFTD